jgi:hypothetical protein
MRLDWALLANSAEVREGVIYVMSGGWDTALRDRFPAPFMGSIAARLLFNRTEVGPHAFEVHLLTADGDPIIPPVSVPLTVEPAPGLPPGWDIAVIVAINLTGVVIPAAGAYVVELLVDRFHVKSLPFRAVPIEPHAKGNQPSHEAG